MSDGDGDWLTGMRREFDETFTRAPAAHVEAEQFLAIRAGGARYAIPLPQISLLAKTPALTAIPAEADGFLGLAALRSVVVPVFSLSRLLHQPADTAAWLVLTRSAGQDAGFAFAEWEGYIREPRAHAESRSGTITHREQTYMILDLSNFLDALRQVAEKEL